MTIEWACVCAMGAILTVVLVIFISAPGMKDSSFV